MLNSYQEITLYQLNKWFQLNGPWTAKTQQSQYPLLHCNSFNNIYRTMRFGKSKNTPAVYEDVTTGLKKIYKVNSAVNSATMYYYRFCKSNNHNINP